MTAPQRSPEWFAARKGRISASVVGAILGNSPYMTADDVMRAMVREYHGAPSEFTGNVATQWGTAMEDHARADFEMDTGFTVVETGFHPFEDWAGCSPDALIGDNGGLELKCPYGIRNDNPPKFKTLAEQPHYLDQVQFTMEVTGRGYWFFAQWTPFGSAHEIADRDREWAARNMPILRQFHARFLHEVEHNADEHLSPRRITIDTPQAHAMVREYDELVEQEERVKERKKDLLAEMTAMAGDKDALFAGRKLTKVQKEGAISYAKTIRELAPNADLEKWRGKASEYWRLS